MTRNLRVGDLVARNAARTPHAPAVIDGTSSTSWHQLDQAANRLASGLLGLGLRRGDRVATVMRNGTPAVEMLFAVAKAGFVGVPINHGLTVSEVEFLLRDSDPHAIVIDDEFADTLADLIRGRPLRVVVIGDRLRRAEPDWISYDDLKKRGSSGIDDSQVSPDDLRTIRYTSGTTAAPKGCMGTHRQILASIANFFEEIPVPADGPFLQLLPLFSGAGIWMSVAAAYQGVPTIVQPAFEPAEALKAAEYAKARHTWAVPTIVGRLTEEYATGGYDLSSLELFGYGGSPMPPRVIRRALETLPCRFYQGFGGGELGGLVAYLQPDEHARARSDARSAERLRSVGRPAKYAEIRILDRRDGQQVEQGELGEIVVRSPSNFSGYWNRPEETAETLRGEWVHTGDMGYFDKDGFLYVVDRAKDMVLTGGMNVSSAEVEAVLMDHPDVAGAAVIGVPDEEWGEAVTAVVILRDGATTSEADLLQYARSRLAGYKTPKSVKFVDSFPMNSAGKILKRELRERFGGPPRR
ncbi:MAG TPA: AMP-binding protein [Actinopolymorphaceae bacterium]